VITDIHVKNAGQMQFKTYKPHRRIRIRQSRDIR